MGLLFGEKVNFINSFLRRIYLSVFFDIIKEIILIKIIMNRGLNVNYLFFKIVERR